MIKIMHMADLHLDSPFSLKSTENAQAMRQMLRGTFTSAILYAATSKMDIVLISGDLFDTGYASKDTLALLKNEFEKHPQIRFVIAPGNHDPYNKKSPYASVSFPSNVYIFKSSAISKFSFDDINTDVYGWAFTEPTMTVDPLATKPALDKSRINILCAHCEIDGPVGGKYCTIGKMELEAAGFDYAALGHIHKGSENVLRLGKTYYAYPGCLEGRSFDECGQKHAVLGEISKENGMLDVGFATRPFTERRFEILEKDVTGCDNISDLIAHVNDAVKDGKCGQQTSVRLILKGQVSPDLIISEPFIRSNVGGIRYLEIIDDTEPVYGCDNYEKDPGIRGAFFKVMRPYITSGTEEERKIASAALRLGLDALNKRT